MINLDWSRDERATDPETYLVDPTSEKESRWRAFTAGWTRFLNGEGKDMDGEPVTWVAVGMFCASVLGARSRRTRKYIYKIMLAQFLSSKHTEHWKPKLRQKALDLIDLED